jgi:catechol 2,3-dioxygenase-like lactoylglutathione lyase family enzyme
MRLELVTVPVSDADRGKAFYVEQAGFSMDQDVRVDDAHRFIELMPPGSRCCIALQTGYVDAAPGSLGGVQLNVDDVDEVHAFLRRHGVEVSDWQAAHALPVPVLQRLDPWSGSPTRCTSRS